MRLATTVLAGCLSAGLFAAEPVKPNEETLARELVAIFQESGDQRSFANPYDAVMPEDPEPLVKAPGFSSDIIFQDGAFLRVGPRPEFNQ